MKINILHWYYDLLNLYGEYGNVLIMKKHLEDQGYEVEIDKKSVGDEIDFEKYSFIYMGCGTEKNLDFVLEDIKKHVIEINYALENKKVFLCTSSDFGVQMDSGKADPSADALFWTGGCMPW